MESLGAQLKRAREQRGAGLEEIAQATKIGTRFLRALEADQYDQLPGGIFNKGFIRAYARAVGLDEEKAIEDYIAATEPSLAKSENEGPTPSRMVELRAEAERASSGDFAWDMVAIVLLLVTVGLAGWAYHAGRSHKTGKLHAASASAGSTTPVTAPAPATPPSVPATPSGSPSAPVVSTASEKQPVGKTTPPASAPASTEPATSPAGYFSVRVNLREDSWLSITADGKAILQGRFLAPAQKSVKATQQVVVQTSNAGGLDFEFNGRRLPPPGQPGEAKTLIFGAEGLEAVQDTTQPPSPQP